MNRHAARILLVDDQPTDLMVLSRAFRSEAPSMVVETSTGGEDAIGKIASNTADIVLLDINMPGIDGFEVLDRARAMRDGSFPVIIMMSTSESPIDIRRAYCAHANAYAAKPADMDGYRAFARSIDGFWGAQALLPG